MQTKHFPEIGSYRRMTDERGRRGVALVIVLAFVVLLTGLIIAFFSRSILDRQISNSSVSRGKVNTFADGATDAIIGELKQEIALNSSATAISSGTIYSPLTPAAMLPQLSGTSGITGPIAPNLLKLSGAGQLFYSGSNSSGTPVTLPASGASNVIAVSSTVPSLNGRYFTPAYWNEHYLLPLPANPSDATPVPTSFSPPSWILVARDGSNPTVWNSNMVASGTSLSSVVGRYAFAIYHEGGLLDVNAAGYPSTTSINQSTYKPVLAYADLTQLPGSQTNALVDTLVAWRNFASIPVPSSSFLTPNFAAASGSSYYGLVVTNTNGFLAVSGSALNGNQTDRMFISRQELIKFMETGLGLSGGSLNVLNYLTTFSRDINQPSFIRPQSINPGSTLDYNATAPKIIAGAGGNNAAGGDNVINPSFLAVRVQTSFTRNDGSIANAGDPLVNKRFALSRLAWTTYRGPSASNMSDPVVQQSITGLGGNPSNTSDPVYQLVAQGNAANIYKYFGLSWVPDPNNAGSYEWVYSHQGTKPLTSAASAAHAAIQTLESVTGRDPDFFELMKAGLCVGSLGKTYSTITGANSAAPGTPAYYEANRDQSVDTQITQIVANIIDQFKADNYPGRILNDFTGTLQEVRGVADLPYLYNVRQGNLMLQDSSPASSSDPQVVASGSTQTSNGMGVVLEEPCIWNPHAWNSSASGISTTPTNFRAIAVTTDPLGNATSNISLTPEWRSGLLTGGPTNNGFYASSVTTTPAQLTAANTELDFNIPSNDRYLFREPTLLIKPNVPAGSNLTSGPSNTISSLPGAKSGYLTSAVASPAYTNNGVRDNLEYLGFVISGTSTLPVSWVTTLPAGAISGTAVSPVTPITTSTCIIPAEYFQATSGNAITYRLQYQDVINPSNFLTYDEKFAPFSCANSYNGWKGSSAGYTWAFSGGNSLIGIELQVSCFDPRTSRFGMFFACRNGARGNGAEDMPIMERGYPNPPYTTAYTGGWASPVGTTANNAASAAQNAIWTNRPDEYQGYPFGTYNGLANGFCYDSGPAALGWYPPAPNGSTNNTGYTNTVIKPGLYTQNNPGVTVATSVNRFAEDNQNPGAPTLACFADADGVVRRGVSAYVLPTTVAPATAPPTGAASGLPMKTAYTYTANGTDVAGPEATSRPIIINRPFRSVAELGYAFSDTPWRNLDFSTPESGAAALLDIFCINDSGGSNPLVAGKVNLNTQQAPVLQAILAGAYKDEFALSTTALSGSGGAASADKIAAALVRRTSASNSNPELLTNIADLVGRWSSSQTVSGASPPFNINGAQSYIGFSGTDAQSSFTASNNPTELSSVFAGDNSTTGYTTTVAERYREVAVRALANAGQTRVWNLMIDLVAQTGRYPTSASGVLANFLVEGEQHYWVHVAIDRYTGQVLDKQIEIVKQ